MTGAYLGTAQLDPASADERSLRKSRLKCFACLAILDLGCNTVVLAQHVCLTNTRVAGILADLCHVLSANVLSANVLSDVLNRALDAASSARQ